MEGYGRSDKHRDITCDIANGADDLAAASEYIMATRDSGPLFVYGISSGALRAALFTERHPERVARLALDAYVWTGEGSRTAGAAAQEAAAVSRIQPAPHRSRLRPLDLQPGPPVHRGRRRR
ncbi:MAG: alpha/beta hydrolase [Gammaproteobacteria bacterium]|nr:alpha/beta hydrolase [Gammaproteobacteria bacterium]